MLHIKLMNMHEDDLIVLAEIILRNITRLPHKILLEGEVGTGKTTFSSKLITQLGTKLPFSSPTYSMVNEYDDVATFDMAYHFDLYRATVDDYDWIFEKLDNEGTITLIEWASLHPELLEYAYMEISFSYLTEFTRNIDISLPNDAEFMKEEFTNARFIFEELY